MGAGRGPRRRRGAWRAVGRGHGTRQHARVAGLASRVPRCRGLLRRRRRSCRPRPRTSPPRGRAAPFPAPAQKNRVPRPIWRGSHGRPGDLVQDLRGRHRRGPIRHLPHSAGRRDGQIEYPARCHERSDLRPGGDRRGPDLLVDCLRQRRQRVGEGCRGRSVVRRSPRTLRLEIQAVPASHRMAARMSRFRRPTTAPAS